MKLIESFLFIPPSIRNFADKVCKTSSEYVVIDFEESIKTEQFDEFCLLTKTLIMKDNVFVRPGMRSEDGVFFIEQYARLLNQGFRKFILPKIENLNDLKLIYEINSKAVNECVYILSIESPISLINANQLINNGLINFWGLIFGSHDFCAYSRITHTLSNLATARFMISTFASAYNLKSIDIASMNTDNKDEFLAEVLSAAENGYSAKAIIHPNQLAWLTEFNINLKTEQVIEARGIIDHYKRIGEPLIFKYQGKIYERPHVKRFMEILNNNQII